MTAEPNLNVIHRKIITYIIVFIIEDRQPNYMHSFGHMESRSDEMPRSRHCLRNPILTIISRCRLYRSRGLFPNRIVVIFVCDKKTYFWAGIFMSGFQHVRHVCGERKIHLMANIKPSHIKSIIASLSINL